MQFGQTNQTDTRQASLRRANIKGSAKTRTGFKTNNDGNNQTGGIGAGVLDAKGILEFPNTRILLPGTEMGSKSKKVWNLL